MKGMVIIMNNHVHSALSGTQTHKNLTDAFGSEARSAMRYLIFANAARDRGDHTLSNLLESLYGNEMEHAELWMRYLGEIGTSEQNIESVIASEEYEKDVMYPEFSETAKNEGFSEIAEKMALAANAENGHTRLLSEYLKDLRNGTLYNTDNDDAEWMCTNCGYTHTGHSVPERCPLCSGTKALFVREDR